MLFKKKSLELNSADRDSEPSIFRIFQLYEVLIRSLSKALVEHGVQYVKCPWVDGNGCSWPRKSLAWNILDQYYIYDTMKCP